MSSSSVAAGRSAREHHISVYTELSQQVRAAGLLRRRYGYYWTRILGTVAAFVAIWVGVVLLGDSWWQLLFAAALALVSTQFGFLGHDTAHRQVFASPTWNAWTSRVLSGLFAGLSYGWWMGKHNGHHNSPNQEDKDPDIGPGVLAFTPAQAAPAPGSPPGWPVSSDQALRVAFWSAYGSRLTACLRRELRGHDGLGRYGGEEFVIILDRLDLGAAHQVADRLRAAISTLHVVDGLQITVSNGLAHHQPEHDPIDLHQLLSRADAALY